MPVPQEKEIRRPLLEAVRGGSPQNFSINDFMQIIAEHFGEDVNAMTSIDKSTLKARINEAKSYLKKHNLLSNPSMQTYMITKSGQEFLDYTAGITDNDAGDVEMISAADAGVIQSQNIDDVLANYNSELVGQLVKRAAALSSETFEALVIDLFSKMGYKAFHNARYTNSDSDNDMIQGVILDTQGNAPIYIHAKKLSPGQTVGISDVKEFLKALSDKEATGIFATTASFSEDTAAYAEDERIMLIDGAKLAGLMIAHNFCVNVKRVFEVKVIDEDSFNEYGK